MPGGVGLVQDDIGRLESQIAALGHRVARVDDQVHDHLLDLPGVGLDAAQIGRRRDGQPDVLADQASQHLLKLHDDRVQIQDLGLEDLLPAEGQELPGQRGGPLSGLSDLVDVPAHLVVAGETREQELGVAVDDRQQIVEVVGDAPRQSPDRLDLLGLPQLLLAAA